MSDLVLAVYAENPSPLGRGRRLEASLVLQRQVSLLDMLQESRLQPGVFVVG